MLPNKRLQPSAHGVIGDAPRLKRGRYTGLKPTYWHFIIKCYLLW